MNNNRNKNWFAFVVFFFSVLVFFAVIANMFFIFKYKTTTSGGLFYSLLAFNVIILIYSIVAIVWSIYKIFKETEQMCFPYPSLTPFIFSYPQSKQSPSEKLFHSKVVTNR